MQSIAISNEIGVSTDKAGLLCNKEEGWAKAWTGNTYFYIHERYGVVFDPITRWEWRIKKFFADEYNADPFELVEI